MFDFCPPNLDLYKKYQEVSHQTMFIRECQMKDTGPIISNNKNMVLKPLSFFSQRFPFCWNQYIQIGEEVDGLRVKSIVFSQRRPNLFKKLDVSVSATVEVINTARHSRMPGFAIAIFDAEGRMLGVASGGTKIGRVRAGEAATFDLGFYQVRERISKAEYFYFSVELTS